MNRAMRTLLPALLAALILSACSREQAPAPAKPESSANLSSAFREFLAENYAVDMARSPYTASERGIKTNQDRWNSVAESHQRETREILEARLQQLRAFDREALDGPLRLSLDLYRLDLERRLAADEFRHHRFVIHQYRGPHTQVASNLINTHTVADLEDARAYIGRLRDVGRWFDEVIEQLRIREDMGLLLADWQYPQMIEAARNVVSGTPFDESGVDSTLLADFSAKVAKLDIGQDERASLLALARGAMIDVVEPAYQRLVAELERQAALAPDADGVWKFEGGDAFYAERLSWFTTTGLDAEEIHAIGLREVARIHDEMDAIREQVGFAGSLQEFFVFMREDPQFYYPNTDAGRADYLVEATSLIDEMRARLPEMFGLLPRAELVVKRVEPFREQSAGKAFYQAPPRDGSRPGIYYANLYDMADMPRYQMEALAYHEGVPGHHMQRAISIELEDLPEFQKYASFTAFTEGWGLYTELVPKEMGLYRDPYSDFGRLAMELWRAARLVVDTGIHHQRWTREQAIDYLLQNTPNSVGDSTRAIERYVAMPGQATAYMIGKIKILELRERARAAMGDAFDIRDFHDLLLKDGPVPLSVLEQKVEKWIASAG